MEKLLTVVVPSYNVEKYLEETLESCGVTAIKDFIVLGFGKKGKKKTTHPKRGIKRPHTGDRGCV